MQSPRKDYREISGGVSLDHDLNALAHFAQGLRWAACLEECAFLGRRPQERHCSTVAGCEMAARAVSEMTAKVMEGMQGEVSSLERV